MSTGYILPGHGFLPQLALCSLHVCSTDIFSYPRGKRICCNNFNETNYCAGGINKSADDIRFFDSVIRSEELHESSVSREFLELTFSRRRKWRDNPYKTNCYTCISNETYKRFTRLFFYILVIVVYDMLKNVYELWDVSKFYSVFYIS